MVGFLRRKKQVPVRYYLYLSQTKIEMLFPQIPKSFSNAFEIEITARTGVLNATVRRNQAEVAEDLSVQAAVIEAYLMENQQVGSIREPASYIKDRAHLHYGVVAGSYEARELAVFSGAVGGVQLSLIGSPKSMVGADTTSKGDHSLEYYWDRFLYWRLESWDKAPMPEPSVHERAQLMLDLDQWPHPNSYEEAVDIVEAQEGRELAWVREQLAEVVAWLPSATTHLEFLAKVLYFKPGVLIATPIYVAFSD